MRYASMHLQRLPHTPPDDFLQPTAELSLAGACTWVPAFSAIPPSYDPTSPSYDPSAASPCNPFPSSSPFSTFTFARPRANATSRLRFEDACAQPQPQPSQPQPQQAPHPALSRIPPPHSAPALRRTKPCRFFLSPAGCKTGRWCNFKHPVGAGSSAAPDGLDALRAAVVRSRKPPTEDADAGVWDDVPDVRDVDPDWGKTGSEGDVHPKWRTQPCRNFLLGLCKYGAKCQFIHAPGLYTGTGAAPTSVPLLLPNPLPVSVWGAHPGVGVPGEADKPEQMSLYYRTKPCKYFNASGTCPHGPECKFIHDPKKAPSSPPASPLSWRTKAQPPPEPPAPVRAPSWADDDRELEPTPCSLSLDDSSMDVDADAMHDVTNSTSTSARRRSRRRGEKEGKEQDQDAKGGIFKATWRVVGGGVGLGTRAATHPEAEDEGEVLEYQPRDAHAHASPPFPDTSPVDYTLPHARATDASTEDYARALFAADPALYPPHELLRAPSPGAGLHVTMGSFAGVGGVGGVGEGGKAKRRVVTGAELMRGITGGDSPASASLRNTGPQRESSPTSSSSSSRSAREKAKPRLTIAVPAFTHGGHRRTQSYGVKGSAGYTPYPYPQPQTRAVAARTDAGDDVLDWSDDAEYGDEGEGDADDDADSGVEGLITGALGEEIRRARSTPPTPRSSVSFLDVPVRPRLVAESP